MSKSTTKQPKQIPNANKIGRPRGSKNKRTIIREALAQTYDDGERGFWLAVAQQSKNGDLQAATMIADRLYPKLKPQSPTVVLSEPLDGTPADMARQLIKMTGGGELSSSQARELLQALGDLVRVIEITEIEERLAALEGKQP